jgi:hypothetical protein
MSEGVEDPKEEARTLGAIPTSVADVDADATDGVK